MMVLWNFWRQCLKGNKFERKIRTWKIGIKYLFENYSVRCFYKKYSQVLLQRIRLLSFLLACIVSGMTSEQRSFLLRTLGSYLLTSNKTSNTNTKQTISARNLNALKLLSSRFKSASSFVTFNVNISKNSKVCPQNHDLLD